MVVRLDAVSAGSEFRAADCAPRASLGNGQIGVTDWVQVGRYVAGLDSLTTAGGKRRQPHASRPGLAPRHRVARQPRHRRRACFE